MLFEYKFKIKFCKKLTHFEKNDNINKIGQK